MIGYLHQGLFDFLEDTDRCDPNFSPLLFLELRLCDAAGDARWLPLAGPGLPFPVLSLAGTGLPLPTLSLAGAGLPFPALPLAGAGLPFPALPLVGAGLLFPTLPLAGPGLPFPALPLAGAGLLRACEAAAELLRSCEPAYGLDWSWAICSGLGVALAGVARAPGVLAFRLPALEPLLFCEGWDFCDVVFDFLDVADPADFCEACSESWGGVRLTWASRFIWRSGGNGDALGVIGL